MMYCYSEQTISIIFHFLQQHNMKNAVSIDCMWDSDEELEAIKSCLESVSPEVYYISKKAGLLDTVDTLQIIQFETAEDAMTFVAKRIKPYMIVWQDFQPVYVNQNREIRPST